MIQTHPHQFHVMFRLRQSRQQRYVTSNQWDSQSGLFITIASNSTQQYSCQVPGCRAIKET